MLSKATFARILKVHKYTNQRIDQSYLFFNLSEKNINWSEMTDYKAGTELRSESAIKNLHETIQQNTVQYA